MTRLSRGEFYIVCVFYFPLYLEYQTFCIFELFMKEGDGHEMSFLIDFCR